MSEETAQGIGFIGFVIAIMLLGVIVIINTFG